MNREAVIWECSQWTISQLQRRTIVSTGKDRPPLLGPKKAMEGVPGVGETELSHGI